MPGSIRLINVNGLSAIVDINTTGTPTEFTAYSDLACTQTVALPATITTDTTFYVKATGVVMLSVTVDGTELAGPARVTLSNAGPATFSLDTDPSNDKSGTLLGLVSTHSSGGSSAVSELLLTLAADFPLTGGDDFPTFQVGRQTGTDITLDNDGNTIIVHKTGLYIATLHPSISTTGATNPALSMWIDCADAFNGELIQCTGLPITPLLPVTGSGVLPAESRLAPNFQFFGGGTNALQSALTFVSVAGPL